MASYDYAVLRLAPDASRGEAINIGIVVFRDGILDVRVGEVLTRARVLFPELNSASLRADVKLLERLGSVDLPTPDRHRALAALGAFRLGEIGCFTTADARDESYQAGVDRLLNVFVALPRVSQPPRSSPLVTSLRKEFRRAKVLAAIGDAAAIADHKIVPRWPIPNRPSLKADFALRNGAMRVCETVDLDLEEEGPPASFFTGVVTLDVARRDAGAQETVFAYRANGPAGRIDEALRIASPHADQLVDLDDKQAREGFMHAWIMAARQAAQPT